MFSGLRQLLRGPEPGASTATLRPPTVDDERAFAQDSHRGALYRVGTDRRGHAWYVALAEDEPRAAHDSWYITGFSLFLYPVRPKGRRSTPHLHAVYLRASAPEYGFEINTSPAVYVSDLLVNGAPDGDTSPRDFYKEGDGLGSLLVQGVQEWAHEHGAGLSWLTRRSRLVIGFFS